MPQPQKKKENLKQRAYLNSVTSLIDYTARIITGFFVTPFLVSGLGSTLFGVWQVLKQYTTYASLADTRATQVLKWAVAKDRDRKHGEELRQYVTSTFILVLLLLPIFLIVGGIIAWYSPIITQVDKEYYQMVRITCALLILALVIEKSFSIFESILRGMNLGFKRMGLRAIIFVCGGALNVIVVLLGFELVELAMVQVFVTISIGISLFHVVKKHVPWFGLGKVNIKQTLAFLRISGWFVTHTGVKMLLIGSDKILLGYLAGPAIVTQYVITKYLAGHVKGALGHAVSGSIPGIGKLYGNREYTKLNTIREHIMLLTWIVATALGASVLLFNEAFLTLWVGGNLFAGQFVNILIIVMVVQYLFIANDDAIISTTLDVSQKVFFGLASALTSIVLIFILVPMYGIAGLCLALIIGRLILSIAYPWIVSVKTKHTTTNISKALRPFITTFFIWGFAIIINTYVPELKWIALIALIILSVPLTALLSFYLGLNRAQRLILLDYWKKLKLFKGQN